MSCMNNNIHWEIDIDFIKHVNNFLNAKIYKSQKSDKNMSSSIISSR